MDDIQIIWDLEDDPDGNYQRSLLLGAIRDRFQKERPSPDNLVDSGECAPLVPHWLYVAAQQLLADLRAERKRRNVTLDELATRSGIAKSTLSQLENGKKDNPTVAT